MAGGAGPEQSSICLLHTPGSGGGRLCTAITVQSVRCHASPPLHAQARRGDTGASPQSCEGLLAGRPPPPEGSLTTLL